MHKDYEAFLDSINLIFIKAMYEQDYKLALQVKALEAKCRGYMKRSSCSNNSIKEEIGLDTSIEGLEKLLESLNKEIND